MRSRRMKAENEKRGLYEYGPVFIHNYSSYKLLECPDNHDMIAATRCAYLQPILPDECFEMKAIGSGARVRQSARSFSYFQRDW